MKLGIVGSRTFTDEGVMTRAVEDLLAVSDFDTIVSGGAIGADSMGADIARSLGIVPVEHLPDKERYGWPAAAWVRNQLIVDDSDILFAFYGPFGESSGTADTVRRAVRKRIPVRLYFQTS
jgi:hypothetical protein